MKHIEFSCFDTLGVNQKLLFLRGLLSYNQIYDHGMEHNAAATETALETAFIGDPTSGKGSTSSLRHATTCQEKSAVPGTGSTLQRY